MTGFDVGADVVSSCAYHCGCFTSDFPLVLLGLYCLKPR
jgi:hypothetical protein